MAALSIVSIAVFASAMFLRITPFYADLLRPFIIINFLGSLRQSLRDFIRDLWSSITVLLTIFAWIYIFTRAGYYCFRFSFEGYAFFATPSLSFFSMLTLFTTANFPDVMLLAYHQGFYYVFFFLIFVIIGIFYLLSILLAIVFDNYKKRIEEISSRKLEKRMDYIGKFYD